MTRSATARHIACIIQFVSDAHLTEALPLLASLPYSLGSLLAMAVDRFKPDEVCRLQLDMQADAVTYSFVC